MKPNLISVCTLALCLGFFTGCNDQEKVNSANQRASQSEAKAQESQKKLDAAQKSLTDREDAVAARETNAASNEKTIDQRAAEIASDQAALAELNTQLTEVRQQLLEQSQNLNTRENQTSDLAIQLNAQKAHLEQMAQQLAEVEARVATARAAAIAELENDFHSTQFFKARTQNAPQAFLVVVMGSDALALINKVREIISGTTDQHTQQSLGISAPFPTPKGLESRNFAGFLETHVVISTADKIETAARQANLASRNLLTYVRLIDQIVVDHYIVARDGNDKTNWGGTEPGQVYLSSSTRSMADPRDLADGIFNNISTLYTPSSYALLPGVKSAENPCLSALSPECLGALKKAGVLSRWVKNMDRAAVPYSQALTEMLQLSLNKLAVDGLGGASWQVRKLELTSVIWLKFSIERHQSTIDPNSSLFVTPAANRMEHFARNLSFEAGKFMSQTESEIYYRLPQANAAGFPTLKYAPNLGGANPAETAAKTLEYSNTLNAMIQALK